MEAHCPRDGSELVEVERSGVRIDACPTCRGVWLDRGELDKVIERAATSIAPAAAAPPPRYRDDDDYREREYREREYRDRDDRYRGGDDDRYRRGRNRRSFLDDIFDFD